MSIPGVRIEKLKLAGHRERPLRIAYGACFIPLVEWLSGRRIRAGMG